MFSGEGIFFFLPLLIVFYIFIRAKLLSLTWDEAYTFFNFVRHSSWLPHDFNYMAANNHLLNTWLMKCSIGLFGETELSLRLPNVLAAAFFFFATIKTLRLLFTKTGQVAAAFLLVALNPFMLDFFSLARGYGISLALMMGAIYQLSLFLLRAPTLKRAIRAEIFLAFAVLSNLTLLHVLAAVSFLLLLHRFRDPRPEKKKKELLLLCIVPLITAGSLAYYFVRLSQCGAFFFGTEETSPLGTISSLADANSYGHPLVSQTLLFLFLAVPAAVFFRFLRNGLRKGEDARQNWSLYLLLATLLSFLFPVIQHFVLGSNYLSGRTGLFFLPLFALLIVALSLLLPRRAGAVLLLIFASAFAINFAFSFNLRFAYDFREQADVKDAIRLLKEKNPATKANLYANVFCADLPYDLPVNYYKMRLGIEQFGHVTRGEELPGASWYYLPAAAAGKRTDLQLVKAFPATATGLYTDRDTGVQFETVLEGFENFDDYYPVPQIGKGPPFIGKQGTKSGGEGALAFSTLSRLERLDTLSVRPVAASISCRINTTTRNTAALLVFQVFSDSDTTWEGMRIAELSVKPGEWSITGWTRPLPPDAKEVRVFIWNESNAIVYMDNVGIRLLAKKEDTGKTPAH